MQKFEDTGVVTNIEGPVHHRFARSAVNIDIVNESVAEDPNVAIPRRPKELQLSYDTLYCILHLNLHLHSYKIQLTQQLKPADHSHVVDTWNGCWNNRQWTTIFRTKFASAMKHISHSVVM